MSSKVSSMSSALEPLRQERRRQKEAKLKRKEVLANFSFTTFIKNWALRLVHTILFLMICYIVIGVCTIMIPTVMGYIIAAFGYTVGNNAEFLLSGLAGMFFTGWVFVGSFVLLKSTWKQYVKNIRKTLNGKSAALDKSLS